MDNRQDAVRPFAWVVISGAGLVFFAVVAVLLGAFGDRLSTLRPSTYFFLLVVIGLAAAGFLSGALRSHTKYSGKAYGGKLELGGPVVVWALVVLLGYKFRPTESSFSVTVNLFASGGAGPVMSRGQLTAYYGSAHVSKAVSEGQITLNELPQELRGKEITLVPAVDGYATKEQRAVIPTDSGPINLYLDKLADSVTISGVVLGGHGGAVVRDAVVVLADGLARVRTDQFGNFRLTLPLKEGTETRLRVYVSDQLKYNSLVILSNQVSLNIPIN